jgi:hypothetical protein
MCLPEVYVFRLERDPDVERVVKMLKMDEARIRTLDQGKFETYSRDRFKKVTP